MTENIDFELETVAPHNHNALYYGKAETDTKLAAKLNANQGAANAGKVMMVGADGGLVPQDGGGGAVDSVNGKTGVVVLNASDVGALPNNTAIPTKTSDLTNDSGFITDDDAVITAIQAVIPAQASGENKLADKNFVNSSIATNTAYYVSNNGQPFTSVEQLNAYSGTVTNNDYAVVTGVDEHGNTYFDRYKATVVGSTKTWAKEYRLNNSSFTAAQWSAISSGITAELVASYSAHVANSDIHVTAQQKAAWSAKQDAISDLSTIRSGAAAGATAVQPEAGKGLFSGNYNDLTNKPTIPSVPTALSELTEDATHRVVTDTEKATWTAKQDAISDLSTIRSGAALGASALQSVPNTYRTAAAQDTIDEALQEAISVKSVVSGTNDGTNWTGLTIDGVTKSLHTPTYLHTFQFTLFTHLGSPNFAFFNGQIYNNNATPFTKTELFNAVMNGANAVIIAASIWYQSKVLTPVGFYYSSGDSKFHSDFIVSENNYASIAFLPQNADDAYYTDNVKEI